MRFTLIDKIVELEPGVRISAVKTLTMAEEYLADHFPKFPVMPGVLMLEAMTEAAAWLIRATENFASSMVVLREAANVKYVQFLEPGQTLVVTAEVFRHAKGQTQVKATGSVDGRTVVSGRLTLASYNLGDERPEYASTDEALRDDLREQFRLLYQPGPGVAHAASP